MAQVIESAKHVLSSRPLVLFATILFIALALRIAGLHNESAWNDEALSLRYLDQSDYRSYADLLYEGDPSIRHVPVYFFVQYQWRTLFGPSVYAARMLSVTCFACSMWVLFLVGRRLYDANAALCAIALYAVSLPHIYFAQEIRFYALITLLATLSIYTFIRADQNTSYLWWGVHLGVNAAIMWTHTMGPLIWVVEGSFLLLYRRGRIREVAFWFGAHISCTLLFVFWMSRIGYHFDTQLLQDQVPTYREFLNAYNIYAGGRFSNIDPAMYLPTGLSFDRLLTVFIGACIALAGFRLARALRARKTETPGETQVRLLEADAFCLVLSLLPPLVLFAVSQLWNPMFFYRYTLFSSLGLYLIAGKALTSISNPRIRVSVCTLLVVIYAHQLTALSSPFRPGYRAAAVHIENEGTPQDRVLIFKKLNGIAFDFNSEIPAERVKTIEGLGELLEAISDESNAVPNVWVLLWMWEDTGEFERLLVDLGVDFEGAEFGGAPPLHLYRVRGASSP